MLDDQNQIELRLGEVMKVKCLSRSLIKRDLVDGFGCQLESKDRFENYCYFADLFEP